MLTPGEFVINKRAANAIGAGNLHAMNAQHFAGGGFVSARDKIRARQAVINRNIKAGNYWPRSAMNIRNRQALTNYGIIQSARKRGMVGQPLNTNVQFGNASHYIDKYRGKSVPIQDLVDRFGKGFTYRSVNGRRGGVTQTDGQDRAQGAKDLRGINRGIMPQAANGINAAANNLQAAAAPMVQAMNSFPRTISMDGNHKVEVIVNGAQVLAGIMPQIQGMIEGEAKRAINKMIKDKFPDVGTMA
jgi:hypothetical protein